MTVCKKTETRSYSSEKLNCSLNYLTYIEKAELNLLDVNDKQKMAVVDNLNKNLNFCKAYLFSTN